MVQKNKKPASPAKSTAAGTEPKRRGRPRAYEPDEALGKALDLFRKGGFAATSLDDLVEATGLQRGGLYYYMKGKQDLLIRIHERFIEPLLENAREIAARHEPPG